PFLFSSYPDREARARRLLVYRSAPLERELEVVGHPLVRLFLRASAPDGALFVYLEEETERGRVLYVTEGELRLVHRAVDDGGARAFRSLAPYRSFAKGAAR